ncbi:hypothetical protein K439DRAFT_161858 [Ramaria rubella]|nr:hypothetical protein K439DRAFT_161858 [Ramaria rubella]
MVAASARTFSPPHSTVSSAQAQSSVQVKKVVVEGRSKHDGASLKMYLKLSVAVDNALPGASIPLFREDNIRIIQSKVHPLDERSVPYHFSSTEQPLLQKAAVALQLGPKSSRPFHTLFPHTSPSLDPTQAGSSRRNRDSTATTLAAHNDERYIGRILISGYNVTLILPKEYPPRSQPPGGGAGSDGEDGFVKDTPSRSTRSARHSSPLFNKNFLLMMVGMEIFLPYAITPPKGPFLISIPVPRCLDNFIKLRISTPSIGTTPASVPRGSFTSASSEDDTPGWDFLTEPPVSRKADKSLRKTPYHQSADDEQSDTPSVPSTPGTELIQGTFQSTDVIHVRWAPPLGKRSGLPKTEDGMRRVGVEHTQGKMKCEVLARDKHCVRMNVLYDGVCTGLWHPGVATILGMDIALDVKRRRISWAEDHTAGWAVSGRDAFSGLYSEPPHLDSLSRKSSFESTSTSTFLPSLANRPMMTPARGSASLLRAPLPNQNTPDYSFENSPNNASPASGSHSAYFPLAPDQETKQSRSDISPGKPVTIKVNLLKLLPPAKNEFTFSIRGTVVIDVEEEDFVPLPIFHVLGSDKETVDTIVSSQSSSTIIQVGTHLTDAPKRTLHKGDEVRCDKDVGLVLGPLKFVTVPTSTHSTPQTPASHGFLSHRDSTTPTEKVPKALPLNSVLPPPGLPCVFTTVTPLLDSPLHVHCVRVNIPIYSLGADSIEFGLVLQQPGGITSATVTIDMLYASYAGRQVHAEVLSQNISSSARPTSDVIENRVVGEMQFLVIVCLENVDVDAGEIEVVYLVDDGEAHQSAVSKGRGKQREDIGFDVLLPCFQLPVARYEVKLDCPSSHIPRVRSSTLPEYNSSSTHTLKLAHYRLPPGFPPVLSLSLLPSSVDTKHHPKSKFRRAADTLFRTMVHLTLLVSMYLLVSMGTEVREVRDTMHAGMRALAHGIPYSDIYWGAGEAPPGDHRYWTQEQYTPTVTVCPTMAPVTWSQQEVVQPATPTINLAEATPVRPERPLRTEAQGSQAGALFIPLPAMPFISWELPVSPATKAIIAKGVAKAWYFLRKIWNFPVDPD